jgi:hypothetical protein
MLRNDKFFIFSQRLKVGGYKNPADFDFSPKLYGPDLNRAENGAADAGTVHANCAGHPGSLDAFLHSEVKL